MLSLRPYQKVAIDGARERFRAGDRSTLVVMPTGCGKTIVFTEMARLAAQRGGRTLVLAHRKELVEQARDKIQRFGGVDAGIDMGTEKPDTLTPPTVVVASVQTLHKRRLAQYDPGEFGLIVVDEAHHATAASYRRILDHFVSARVVGVTATPDRADGTGLRKVFDSTAYVYDIRDAIEEGYLVPLVQRFVQVECFDLSSVRVTRKGDFNDDDLAAQIKGEAALHEIAAPTVEQSAGRPTIVFVPGVEPAHALADVINGYDAGHAAAIDGKTDRKDRADIIDAFQRGEVRYLVNCAVLTEGFDAPPIACVAVARPTRSRALYAQMVGRGTRLSPETGKRDLLVLDFVGASFDHKLISAADVLDGNADADVKRAVRTLVDADPDLGVLEALAAAEDQVAKERRAAVAVKARYRTVDVSPFDVLGAPAREGRWGGAPITERQAAALEKFGVEAVGIDRGQASALLDKLVKRSREGLCTYKMARVLARHGLNPDVPFDAASEAMKAIAAAGWKRAPAWLLEDPRFAVAGDEAAA